MERQMLTSTYPCTCRLRRGYNTYVYLYPKAGTSANDQVNSTNAEWKSHQESATASINKPEMGKENSVGNSQKANILPSSSQRVSKEKIRGNTIQEKNKTITSLRLIIEELEKKLAKLTTSQPGQNFAQIWTNEDKDRTFEYLLAQIDELQKDRDDLLFEVKRLEENRGSNRNFQAPISASGYTVESMRPRAANVERDLTIFCTTDTEKELEQMKEQKQVLVEQLQKLKDDNMNLQKLLNNSSDSSQKDKRKQEVLSLSIEGKTNREKSSPQQYAENKNKELTQLKERIKSLELQVEEQVLTNEKQSELLSTCEKSIESYKEKESGLLNLNKQLNTSIKDVFSNFTKVKSMYYNVKKDKENLPQLMLNMFDEYKQQVKESMHEINRQHNTTKTKYLREMKLRKKLHNELVDLKGNIRVLCRVRPSIKEDEDGDNSLVVTVDNDDDGLINVDNKGKPQSFDFDKVFGEQSKQEEVFEEVSHLVRSVIDGYNVCIFAYGQTGSGKTFTMEGPHTNPGINQRALELLFEETHSDTWRFEIEASVMEIYNESIRDLLNPDPENKLEVRMSPEGGLHVPGVTWSTVTSLQEVNQVFAIGKSNRATASTNMNEHSSRSHCLLCVNVRGHNTETNTKSTGRLNLVDLAGSERVGKSQADGLRLREAQNINRSLSCLGDVINALKNKLQHVPYRNSKLTYMLQESLGGDSKTLMIVQVAPVGKNLGETVCSLNFGQRVREVQTGQATKNVKSDSKRPNNLQLQKSPSLVSLSASPSPSPKLSRSQRFSTSSLSSLTSPITSSTTSLTSPRLPSSSSLKHTGSLKSLHSPTSPVSSRSSGKTKKSPQETKRQSAKFSNLKSPEFKLEKSSTFPRRIKSTPNDEKNPF